jgi:dolichyl-phosphate-mannose-protein mannosyltransferase
LATDYIPIPRFHLFESQKNNAAINFSAILASPIVSRISQSSTDISQEHSIIPVLDNLLHLHPFQYLLIPNPSPAFSSADTMGRVVFPLFTTADCFCLVFVCFLALFTRLWLIADPDRVTFDEVHFGNFTNWYIQRRFHFDIHPPLGKMLMATIAGWTQYKGDIDYASKFGQAYTHDELFFVSQRITPAIFSAFTSPLIYAACRCLRFTTLSAACAGIILTSDLSLIVEGKFILSDGLLHFFVALHIFALCLFLSNATVCRTVFSGLTLGAAAACKYTALGLLAIDGATQLVWLFLARPGFWRAAKRALQMLAPAIAVFLSAWIWHFVANPFDGHCSEYLEPPYQSTIIPKPWAEFAYWGDRLRGPNLLMRIIHWNIVMNRINMRSDIPHPFESEPINWPLLLDRGVGFLAMEGPREIYCLGTPFVYWFTFVGICLGAIGFFVKRGSAPILLLIWSWCVSYFPFVLVPRTMFLYHYLVPLMFAVMNLVAIIEKWAPSGYKAGACVSVTLLCFGCYLFFAPWGYGTRCPDCKSTRLWTERWLHGPPKVISLYGIEMFNTTEKYRPLPV